jgi:hypothetical protein
MNKLFSILFFLIACGYFILVWHYRSPLPQDLFYQIKGEPVSIEAPTIFEEFRVYETNYHGSHPHFTETMIEKNSWLDTVWNYRVEINCRNNLSQTFFIDSVVLLDRITHTPQPSKYYVTNMLVSKYDMFDIQIATPLKFHDYSKHKTDHDSLMEYLFRSKRISFKILTSMGAIYCIPQEYKRINCFDSYAIKKRSDR